MPVLDRDGVKIAWSDEGEGVPILLIMGHRYSSRMWYPVFEGLGDRFRLISFDNQGTGASGARRRTSIREMTDDALAVLDAAGVDSAHVYGVSMGGGIALEFGIRHPERTRSLILGCTMAKTPEFDGKRSWLAWAVYRLPTPILKALAPKKHNNGYGDAAPADRIARDLAMLEKDPFSRRGVWAQAVAISDYSVDPAEVRAVAKPALVLHGTQDLAVPYAEGVRLADMLPNARLVTFEKAGHNYFVAEGDRANAEVERFIAEVEQAR
jgi:3-oxoadipate enol-lactonase